MKIIPLICDVCRKDIILGQIAMIVETDNDKFLVHARTGEKPGETCLDVIRRIVRNE